MGRQQKQQGVKGPLSKGTGTVGGAVGASESTAGKQRAAGGVDDERRFAPAGVDVGPVISGGGVHYEESGGLGGKQQPSMHPLSRAAGTLVDCFDSMSMAMVTVWTFSWHACDVMGLCQYLPRQVGLHGAVGAVAWGSDGICARGRHDIITAHIRA